MIAFTHDELLHHKWLVETGEIPADVKAVLRMKIDKLLAEDGMKFSFAPVLKLPRFPE